MARCWWLQLTWTVCKGLNLIEARGLSDTNTNVTSILLLPELGIRVEHEAGAALLPLELDLLLEEPLPRPLLLRHVLVQGLVPLPLLARVIVLRGQRGRELGDASTAPSPLPDPFPTPFPRSSSAGRAGPGPRRSGPDTTDELIP